MNRKRKSHRVGWPRWPHESDACPCGSLLAYAACCRPLHAGALPDSAVALMRSRYSAYVIGIESYLLASWHHSTRPPSVAPDPSLRWLGLEVRRQIETGPDTAIVEFVARYRLAGRGGRLHEVSRFVREAGRWYYRDGKFPECGEPGAAPAGAAFSG